MWTQPSCNSPRQISSSSFGVVGKTFRGICKYSCISEKKKKASFSTERELLSNKLCTWERKSSDKRIKCVCVYTHIYLYTYIYHTYTHERLQRRGLPTQFLAELLTRWIFYPHTSQTQATYFNTSSFNDTSSVFFTLWIGYTTLQFKLPQTPQ